MQNAAKITAFKAFNTNLTCLGFQYEVGKTHFFEGDAVVCKSGFHACPKIADVNNYYDIRSSLLYKVECAGQIDYYRNDTNQKFACTEIRLVEKIDVKAIFKLYKDIIQHVFKALQARDIHPTGSFDKSGRWYAEKSHLISVRTPSRAYPYSEMLACRAKKYVEMCALELHFEEGEVTLSRLLNYV